MTIQEKNKFPKLTDLAAHLKKQYEKRWLRVTAKDQAGTAEIPAFLFRGEAEFYPKTLTSLQRMRSDDTLAPIDQKILEKISIYVDQEVQSRFGIGDFESKAYAQHYGLYSWLVDFTEDVDIATRFATSAKTPFSRGRMAVLDVDKARRNGVIVDLRSHPFAVRPRRQMAYGVFNRQFTDLKTAEAISAMGLTWYEYAQNDTSDQIRKMDIYNVSDDAFVGVLSLIIDQYINEYGRIPDKAALQLKDRVDRVPLFAVTEDLANINKDKLGRRGATAAELGFDKCSWRLCALGELNCKINVTVERLNSYRKWSIASKEPPGEIEYQTASSLFALRIVNLKMMNNWQFT